MSVMPRPPTVAPPAVREPLSRLLANLTSGELHGAAALLGPLDEEQVLDLYRLVGLRSALLANPRTHLLANDHARLFAAARSAARAALTDLVSGLCTLEVDARLLGELLQAIWPPKLAEPRVEAEDPFTSEARSEILDAIAHHAEAPPDVLERLLVNLLVTPDTVRNGPALVLLGLEPFEVLVRWPNLARLAELPPRTAARIEIAHQARQPLEPAAWNDVAAPWTELLGQLDDIDLVHEALWTGVRDAGARAQVPLHAWVALTLDATALARTVFIKWLLTGADDAIVRRHNAFPPSGPSFGDVDDVLRVIDRIVLLGPGVAATERLGDAVGELIERLWPRADAQRRRERLVRTIIERLLAVGGADDQPVAPRILTSSLAPVPVLTSAVRSLARSFDVPPSRRSAIHLSKALLEARGEELPKEVTVVLGRWGRQEG